jgi:hypothetical protein
MLIRDILNQDDNDESSISSPLDEATQDCMNSLGRDVADDASNPLDQGFCDKISSQSSESITAIKKIRQEMQVEELVKCPSVTSSLENINHLRKRFSFKLYDEDDLNPHCVDKNDMVFNDFFKSIDPTVSRRSTIIETSVSKGILQLNN